MEGGTPIIIKKIANKSNPFDDYLEDDLGDDSVESNHIRSPIIINSNNNTDNTDNTQLINDLEFLGFNISDIIESIYKNDYIASLIKLLNIKIINNNTNLISEIKKMGIK